MVTRLAQGDTTVGDLAAPYHMSLQGVSKHLKVLEAAGIVSRRPHSQRHPVHLEVAPFGFLAQWLEHYGRLAAQREPSTSGADQLPRKRSARADPRLRRSA